MAKEHHAIAGELVQVERVSTALSRDVRLSEELCPWRRQVVHGSIVETYLLRPPIGIFAAISPRHATSPSDRKIDLPSILIELLGNLATRLGASDYHHCSRRQALGIVIAVRV